MRFLIKIVLPVLVFSCILSLISSATSAIESIVPRMKKEMTTIVRSTTGQAVIQQQSPLGASPRDEFSHRLSGGPQREQVRRSLCYRFIISRTRDVKRNHIVERGKNIKAALADGMVLDASLIVKAQIRNSASVKGGAGDISLAS